KIRSGPDATQETAPEVAHQAEAAGASAIDVHARSVAQAYAGGADWAVGGRGKEAVSIAVLGSGGWRDAGDGIRVLGVHAGGGGWAGNRPWLARQALDISRCQGAVAKRGAAAFSLPRGAWPRIAALDRG